MTEYRQIVRDALKGCRSSAEEKYIRDLLSRESKEELDKKIEHYNSRIAELEQNHVKACSALVREYEVALRSVQRDLGQDVPSIASETGTSGENKAEVNPTVRYLGKLGYDEQSGRGQFTITEKSLNRLDKIRNKFVRESKGHASTFARYEALGMTKDKARLASSLHVHLASWHLGFKKTPPLSTFPRSFSTALSRVKLSESVLKDDEGNRRPNAFNALNKVFCVIGRTERLRQFICKSNSSLSSELEVEQNVKLMVKFIEAKVNKYWKVPQLRGAFGNSHTNAPSLPSSVTALCVNHGRTKPSFYAQLSHESRFAEFLRNNKEDQPKTMAAIPKNPGKKRKRIDKDHAYFGLSTTGDVKKKKQKLLEQSESDHGDRLCLVVNKLLKAKKTYGQTDEVLRLKKKTYMAPEAILRVDLDELVDSLPFTG